MNINTAKIESLVRQPLLEIGEDPEREGLLKTPERVAAALAFLTSGYRTDPVKLINGAVFTQETNSMVIVKNIEMYSLCEHHMLPFFGRCHIGYVPSGRVFGVSKLARLVDMYARRLQLQERLTEQISQVAMESIDAKGVGVMIEARHLCPSESPNPSHVEEAKPCVAVLIHSRMPVTTKTSGIPIIQTRLVNTLRPMRESIA